MRNRSEIKQLPTTPFCILGVGKSRQSSLPRENTRIMTTKVEKQSGSLERHVLREKKSTPSNLLTAGQENISCCKIGSETTHPRGLPISLTQSGCSYGYTLSHENHTTAEKNVWESASRGSVLTPPAAIKVNVWTLSGSTDNHRITGPSKEGRAQ